MTTRTITLSAERWREISEALDCYCDEGCPEGGPGWKSAKLSDACNSFAAALAQPEPEGLTDEELLAAQDQAVASFPPIHPEAEALSAVEYARELEIRKGRAVLARWGRPTIEPVPEPKGPSDDELDHWWAEIDGGPDCCAWRPYARAVIAVDRARWGRPATAPISASEFLEPEWMRQEDQTRKTTDHAQLIDGEWWAPCSDPFNMQRILDNARAHSRPAIEPVPVAERLPEPGVKVLAHYLNSHGKSRTVCARWIPAKFESRDPETDDLLEYDEDSDTFYWPEGWYEEIENWDDYQCVTINEGEVTHWQPLPHWALPVPNSQED